MRFYFYIDNIFIIEAGLKMNYSNLSDVEFEYLCKDVMSRKLSKKLERFGPGRDGGIDLSDTTYPRETIVQVKHYVRTDFSGLIRSLEKEVPKVKEHAPKHYYVCCSKELSPQNKIQIYELFSSFKILFSNTHK